jgi:hypothetical protein
MSWGYIVRFELKIPTKKLTDWKALSQGEHPLSAGWPSKALASYFERQTDGETLGDALAYPAWGAEPTVEKKGDETIVKLTAIVDRSLLYLGGVAPALLLGAAQVGGGGTVEIINDGTTPFEGEDGWRLAVAGDKLATTVLAPDEAQTMRDELEAQLLAEVGIE